MPAMEGGPSPHRWNQIRRLPLNPAIRSLTDYEEAVKTGNLDALAFLRGIDPLQQLAVADILHAHYEIFKAAHPWAGQVRTSGQLATVSGYPAADPGRILRELATDAFPDAGTVERGNLEPRIGARRWG